MKINRLNALLIVSILISFIFISCKTNQSVNFDEYTIIKIISFDETKFEHYVEFKFSTNRKNRGYILVDKEYYNTVIKLRKVLSNQIKVKLCRIHQYKSNNSDIVFRSNRSFLTKIYVDEELEIDLSENAKIRYYQICSEFE
jgi:hypothetical protein